MRENFVTDARIALDLTSDDSRAGEAPGRPRQASAYRCVLQGEALLALEDFAGAERELLLACEAFPDEPRLWELLATASWNVGRRAAAFMAIDRVLALRPSGPLAVLKGWMLRQDGDLAQAEATLIDAIDRFPGCKSAYRNLTQVYKSWERWTPAADMAARACAEDPTDFDMRESWASCLVAAGRPHEAVMVIEAGLKLLDAAPAPPDYEPRLWQLLATASWSIGRREAALSAIDRALALAPDGPLAVQKGWMLCQNGELARAEAILIDAIDRFPGCKSAYRNLTQVYKSWERWTTAAEMAERACAEDPADFDMRESWASCLVAADHPSEAMAVIEAGLQLFDAAPARFQLLMLKAEAHQQLGDVDRAIDAVTKAVELVPDNEAALEKLCHLMANKSGRRDDARQFLARLRESQARQLPERLSDGLARIWERTREIQLDEEAVEWAWELADKSIWDRGRWQAAAAWGKEASLLLLRWRETMPTSQVNQIDELVDQPDLSEPLAVSTDGRACFLIGAHVGPLAAGVNFFVNYNQRFRRLRSADRGRLDNDTGIEAIPSSIATVRAITDEIKNGGMIGIMADEITYASNRLRVEFLGRHVELPTLVPRLIQKFNGASFWCCPLWSDGRITFQLEQLPDPTEGEPDEMWSRCWFAAYLSKLEVVMRGRPENLGLFAGIWGNVNRTILRERQRAEQTGQP
jgi:tetratricopeptide (TPR) repeat protein